MSIKFAVRVDGQIRVYESNGPKKLGSIELSKVDLAQLLAAEGAKEWGVILAAIPGGKK